MKHFLIVACCLWAALVFAMMYSALKQNDECVAKGGTIVKTNSGNMCVNLKELK